MGLGDEKYLALTTYKRSGDAVLTPVWVVPLDDGSLGFWTSSGSGKAKRLAHTAKVVVQPSDVRGRVTAGSSPTDATAVVITPDDPRYAEIQRKVKAKYGFMCVITPIFNTIGGIIKRKRIPYGDRGVVITV